MKVLRLKILSRIPHEKLQSQTQDNTLRQKLKEEAEEND